MMIRSGIYREGDQGRRYIDLIEGTGHTVLTADRGKSKAKLRIVSAQESRERIAPALRVRTKLLEELLEGEADLTVIAANCHDLRHGGDHRVDGSVTVSVVPCRTGSFATIACVSVS